MKQRKGPDTGSEEPGLAGALPEAGGSAAPSRIAKWLKMAVLLVAAAVPGTTVNGCESHEVGQENLDLLSGIKMVHPNENLDGAQIITDFPNPTDLTVTLLSSSGKELDVKSLTVGAGSVATPVTFGSNEPLFAPPLSTLEIKIDGVETPFIISLDPVAPVPDFPPPKGEGS